MKQIAHFDHPSLAHLCSGYLEAHGIRTKVVGDSLVSGGSVAPNDMRATVYIFEEDEERALVVLAKYAEEYEQSRIHGEPWNCPACGDLLPPAFAECPVCLVVQPPRKARPR